ncbi:3-phosphoshikimate 1-carboxyvinyltransferase [Vallitalea guaymasensis]|uniref:3-phosphoshikimate 1-carboxyvinyltransferase n=1 Tax=Vallitalea guaymasensis TaxID=1185412 RepID=A0A8J8SAD8_9FIRM|nr:3-phosphoshikimate 1-carboxyvinyltransferase [Vallitalea guaymasensis]QUH27489.1 3-phosphoshikimate 1-carboxyvinyltransferase [Vallitalea guaymasensis]
MIIHPVKSIQGEINVPGDKSISHRAIMLGALSKGITNIKGFLMGEDCLSTIRCFRDMGIDIEINDSLVTVNGRGLHGLKKPENELYVGNSGTTLRLMSGILAPQDFDCIITGDDSIKSRPMKRIIDPLTKMGANIVSIESNNKAPLKIIGSKLHNITHNSFVASAQVKSCIILASLYTENDTKIIEPVLSRNHTEIMLNYFGGNITTEGSTITSTPVKELYAKDINIPGDISSAAFFMVACLITKNSQLVIKNVGINPTRDGIITVLKAMNGDISLLNEREINGELVADIKVKSSKLSGTVIDKDIIPALIDEIPVIAVAACFAEGKTIIKDAQELKVKESNRIETMVTELSKMGADIIGTDDGMIISHSPNLRGATVKSYNDHRVAMSLAIAGLVAEGKTDINESECIDISFPGFYNSLQNISDL